MSDLDRRRWLDRYIDEVVVKRICTTTYCTTCGAREFRQGLLDSLAAESQPARTRRVRCFTVEEARLLLDGLKWVTVPSQDAGFNSSRDRTSAIRFVLKSVWDALGGENGEPEMQRALAESWAGAELDQMIAHHRNLQAQHAEFVARQDPERVAHSKIEKRRLKALRHQDRLEAKKERDRAWHEKQAATDT